MKRKTHIKWKHFGMLAVIAAALALSACSADTAATAKTETVAAAETTTAQAVKATEKQTTKTETTAAAGKATEQTTATPVQDVTEQTTTAMTHADEPVTQRETEQTTTPPFADPPTTTAPGNGGRQEQTTTTAHTHTWEWIEPVTHVETIYETVYHPPVTETWTHQVRDGYQYRCLRCNEVFLDDRECVEHCIICGGSMTTEAHYIEVTEEIVIQEEYWSDEPVGTRVVTDREGYWQCTGCGATK